MAKPKNSYAELVSQAQVMATGLKNKAEEVAKRGIDTDFVKALEDTRAEAIKLNDEQERLKAELKVKTDELNKTLETLTTQLRESKKVVKLSIPQAGWLEFGIADKR